MSAWHRIDEQAHIWTPVGDMVEPLCQTELLEWPYMLESVSPPFDLTHCCQQCQILDRLNDPRETP